MHRLYRFFFFFVLAGGLLALGGCKKPAAGYDSLRGDILADLAEALENGNAKEIEKSLDRLEKLTRVDGFVGKLREREATRMLMEKLGKALQAGDTDQARRVLAANRQLISSQADLLILRKEVEALERLDSYLEQAPFDRAAPMDAALREVQRSARFLADSTVFTTWLQGELDRLNTLRSQERREKIQQLLDICDQAVIEQDITLETTFANLMALAPDSTGSVLYKALRDGDAITAGKILENAQHFTNLDWKGAEAALLASRKQVTENEFYRLLDQLPLTPPLSLSGHILKIYQAAASDQPGAALKWLRRFIDQGGTLTPSLSGQIIPLTILPTRQFNARPWRMVCPATDHLLARYIQWTNVHLGAGE